MLHSLTTIRLFFFLLCLVSSGLMMLVVPEWQARWGIVLFVGACLGGLVILVDQLLKGFSLRGFSSLTFGIFVGWIIALMISNSPLFEVPLTRSDASEVLVQNAYLLRLALFLVLMYLGAVVALRGRDEFNLVIPYVRFVPHGVTVPLVVVDTSALIDGRLLGICQTGFLGYGLIIPRFVVDELQRIADSPDQQRRMRGRRGLGILKRLRELPDLDLRLLDTEVEKGQTTDDRLIYLAQSSKACLLTTDFNLAQVAEFHGIRWLNLSALSKALSTEVTVGEHLEVELVKPGREPHQAIGYLSDGSMVVVKSAREQLGTIVMAEVESVVPSAGGRILFARLSPAATAEGAARSALAGSS